jgi:hypothetical protein
MRAVSVEAGVLALFCEASSAMSIVRASMKVGNLGSAGIMVLRV